MKVEEDIVNALLGLFLAIALCFFLLICLSPDLNSKDKVEVIYDDNGIVEYVKINNVEHQVIPTPKVDLMLDTIEMQKRQIELRDEQIDSFRKISDRQKADLQMCRADRQQAYNAINACKSKERPLHEEPLVAFAGGYAVCAATFAVWQYTQ